MLTNYFFIRIILHQIHQVVLPLGIAAPIGLARLGIGAAAQVFLINHKIEYKVCIASQ